MPIVVVSYGLSVSDGTVAALAASLPHWVSLAVECPEEPYDHDLQPGDVTIGFQPLGPHDVCALDLLVEVRSKWFESRARDRDERCARLRDLIRDATGIGSVGVYLSLPVAGWAQTGD